MRFRSLYAATFAATLTFLGGTIHASTILNFNTCPATPVGACIAGSGMSAVTSYPNPHPEFGDNVSQALDPNGLGFYGGAADTPDVTLTYTEINLGNPVGMAFWSNYSGGNQVLGLGNPLGSGDVALIAAPGFQVTLNSFDVGADQSSNSNTLEILDGSNNVLHDYSGTTFTNASLTRISPNLTGSELVIRFTNWDTGLTNIDFSESSLGTTPEPASWLLLGAGLAALAVWRKRAA